MKSTLGFCVVTPLCFFVNIGCSQDSTDTSLDLSVAPDLSQPPAPPPDLPILGPTDFFALRIGDGTTALAAGTSAALYLERRKLADGALVSEAVPLPVAVTGMNQPITLAGDGISEGALTRSADGRYLLLAGYAAAPKTASVLTTAKRVIGRIGMDGTIDTSTVYTPSPHAGNTVRSAASVDGTGMWVSEEKGIGYMTFASMMAPVAVTTSDMRVLGIFGGQLFCSRSSNVSGGINSIGTGMPTTANAAAKLLPGFPTTGNTLSSFGYIAFDRDATPGIDRLYIADDRRGSAGGGVQRWTLSGTSWQLDGTMSTGLTSGARGLDGYVNGNSIVLVTSSAEPGGAQTRILSFTDTGGMPSSITPVVLANAPAKTAYRGVAMAPSM